MRPFDLKAAERGELICTRDGHAAEFVGIDDSAIFYNVKVRVIDKHAWDFYHYTEDGEMDIRSENDLDLFMLEDGEKTLKL